MKNLVKTIISITIFSIAMGYMEAAVVVYLRKLFYPQGFDFPLVQMSVDITVVEIWREAATIIMLILIGIIAGKNSLQRFSFFIYCFAVWDIFYYLFLKIILDWPLSLLTWDILFLIPVPWVGPIITPVIVSFTMILLTLIAVVLDEKDYSPSFSLPVWLLLLSGALIIIYSFVYDYFSFLNEKEYTSAIWKLNSEYEAFSDLTDYVPGKFNWFLFIIGEITILGAIILFVFQTIKKQPAK